MNDPLAIKPYYAALSASFATKQNLMTLLIAAYAALNIAIPNFAASEVLINPLEGNAVGLLIGDDQLSTTNYGYLLDAGSTRRYGPYQMAPVPMDNIYVMAADGSTSIQIGIEAFSV